MIGPVTTTVKVEEPSWPSGRSEPPTWTERGRRAGHVSAPSGREAGTTEQVDAVVLCEPITFSHEARITDLTTLEVWDVAWIRQRIGLGLDHTQAGVRRSKGAP